MEWIDRDSKETRFIPESLVASDYLDAINSEPSLHPIDPYVKAQQRVLVERFDNVKKKLYFKIKNIPFFFLLGDKCLL